MVGKSGDRARLHTIGSWLDATAQTYAKKAGAVSSAFHFPGPSDRIGPGGRRNHTRPYILRRMPELITHKADPACPMTGPHDPAICGLVADRHRRSAEMNAAIDRQEKEEQERQSRRS